MRKIFLCLTFLCINTLTVASAVTPQGSHESGDPCADGNILTYFKRPTVITSACPVPYGKFTLESGLQYNSYVSKGEGLTYPQAKVRIGLPWRSELSVILPSEITNSYTHISGLSSAEIGLKHNIAYTDHWSTAIRALYLPASGSKHYGTSSDGFALNGILAYKIYQINITAMASVATLSTPKAMGGKRFNTFNPDIAMGWYITHWLQLYGEVYGQTRSAPNLGAGYNLDTGFLFLMTKYIAADIEVGQRLYGQLGNFNTYYGTGISVML